MYQELEGGRTFTGNPKYVEVKSGSVPISADLVICCCNASACSLINLCSFLKKLYPADIECPRSYDKLRFDPSKEKCRLLVTHDDYSLLSKLPKERTSVVTILRNPIDRVFSAYEFSIEVGARFLIHPNLTSATRMAGRLRVKNKGVSTLDIWPWKYLVPWMREDLFARRDARKQSGSVHIKSKDPYQMEEIVMPLHKYIEDPIAQDIVHNGATFQVNWLAAVTKMGG